MANGKVVSIKPIICEWKSLYFNGNIADTGLEFSKYALLNFAFTNGWDNSKHSIYGTSGNWAIVTYDSYGPGSTRDILLMYCER